MTTTPSKVARELVKGLKFTKEERRDGLDSWFFRGEDGTVIQVIGLRRQTTLYVKTDKAELPAGLQPSKQGRWSGRCVVGEENAERARAIVEQLVGRKS